MDVLIIPIQKNNYKRFHLITIKLLTNTIANSLCLELLSAMPEKIYFSD